MTIAKINDFLYDLFNKSFKEVVNFFPISSFLNNFSTSCKYSFY